MPPKHRQTTSGLRLEVRTLRNFRSGYDPVLNGVAHGLGDLFPPVPHPEPVRTLDPRVPAPAKAEQP